MGLCPHLPDEEGLEACGKVMSKVDVNYQHTIWFHLQKLPIEQIYFELDKKMFGLM
jgi:hypothetical protein